MGARTALLPPCTRRWPCLVARSVGLGLCAWLAALAAPAALLAEEPSQPLPIHGFAASDAVHALVSIAAGDADAVAALDPQLWHRGAAIPDHDNIDLAVRWTRRIGDALGRCPADRCAAVLAAIERAAQADLAAHPRQPWRARDYLPAPAAIAALREESARAFDHGDFAHALELGALVGPSALGPPAAARQAAAQLLSGLDETIDPALQLVPPGEPVAEPLVVPAPRSAAAQGLTVRWAVQPGWILALCADGVAWQYRVDLDAEVVTGPGAALVRDHAGTRLIAEDGTVSVLTPPPAGTRLLAVGGGAAWFASGTRAWRMPIHGSAPEVLELGAEAVCAPLVRGDESLWLLEDRMALFRRGELSATMRHHLAVGPAWRVVAVNQGAPVITAPDGGTWRIEPLADQLARAEPIERARLLLAAAHPADALALLGATNGLAEPSGRAVAFAAHVALGADHLHDHADEVAALAPDAASRDLVRYTAWRLGDPGLKFADAKPVRDLKAAIAQDPTAHVSWDIADLGLDEEHCAHITSAAVLLSAMEGGSMVGRQPAPRAERPLAEERDSQPEQPSHRSTDVELQDPQFGHVHAWGDALIALSHARGETILECYDQERRTLRWRTRWPSDEDTHSRALALRDGHAVVAEGTSRLILVDLGCGSVLMRLGSASVPLDPARACICGTTVVVPSPLDDAVVVAHAGSGNAFTEAQRGAPDQAAHCVGLANRLRWMVPMRPFSAVLVGLEGNGALAFSADPAQSDGMPVQLPAGIGGSPRAPTETADGLTGTDGTYSWAIPRGGSR